jgi:hypothetical protein
VQTRLSPSFCAVLSALAGGGLFWGGSSNTFFCVIYGQHQWWVGRFVPMLMMVVRGDSMGTWCSSRVSILQ